MVPALAEEWAEARPGPRARARWQLLARPSQLTPGGVWNVWLFMAGRGAGKTRSAAEDMAYFGLTRPRSRLAVVAPTYADARDTCVEGESGLLACLPHEEVQLWNRSLGELILRNGSRYKLLSSDEPERLRGPQFHRAWCDELAAFRDFATWDMLQMGLRLGAHPQTVVTTTPRPVSVIRELLDRRDVVVTRGTTWDNAANLAPAALEALRRRYEGTRLGRQELEGLLIEDIEGALWRQAQIDECRVSELPHPVGGWRQMPVVGLDPSDGNDDGAEHALAVVGLALDNDLYLLESDGMRCTPYAFCQEALDVAVRHRARIVVERNHGGQWLVEVLERALKDRGVRVPYKSVHASQGKRTRAEPVAALYEQGRVHHVGEHPELERQLTTFTGAAGETSPDRLDALVWAASEFTGHSFRPGLSTGVERYSDRPVAGVVRWG